MSSTAHIRDRRAMPQSARGRGLLAGALLVAALVAATSGIVQAQTTGTISGYIFDQTGRPLSGVSVTLSSPTQIGGTKVAISNDEGQFRFLQLTPGVFRLEAKAPQLRPFVQTGLRVFQNKAFQVDIIMEVDSGKVEEYIIKEKAPLIDTSSAAVGAEFDSEMLDQLPLAQRDYQGVATLTPGVVDSTRTGNPSVMGGSFFNNKYTIDGFDTTDPVSNTFGTNFSFDAIASEQVLTAGFGIENSDVLGGVINVVTKSGSNRLEINTSATYEDFALRLFTDNLDRNNGRDARVNVSVGGPIIRDRVWFYVSTAFTHIVSALPLDPSQQLPPHAPFSILGFTGFSKITWQVNPRNKIELKTSFEVSDFRNTAQSPLVENGAEEKQLQRTTVNNILWNSIITDDLIANLGFSFLDGWLDVGPMSCALEENCLEQPGEFDLLTGQQRRNGTSRERDARRRFELRPTLEWFTDAGWSGAHQIKLGAKVTHGVNPQAVTVPGDEVLFTFGNQPFARQQVCVNDPLIDGECRTGWLKTTVSSTKQMYFLADQWKPTRYLQIMPQIALHRSVMNSDLNRQVLDIWAVTPHLYVTWDPTHDGKTKLSAGYGEYVDTGFLALARFSALQLTERQCLWDEDLKGYVEDCRTFGGEGARTIGLPCGPDGLNPDGTSCRTKLKAPKKLEYVLTAEREVSTGIVAGVSAVYRRYDHQWEDLETNAIWNASGTEIRDDGGWKTGRSQFVFDLETPNSARKRYFSITPKLQKREGRFRFLGAYTWTQFRGTSNNSFQSTYLDNPGQAAFFYGPLPEDYRHNIKVQSLYQALAWLSFGVSYDFLSGGPYNRFFRDPEFQSFQRFGARRGYDSRGDLNPDNDVPLRLPDLSILNLQARVNLAPVVRHNLEFWVDMENLLALRTTTSVIQTNGPFFGQQISRLPPLSLRLGMRYRY